MKSKTASETPEIRLISVSKIRIVNPRVRDPKKFDEIVQSISTLGLKKPIIVSRRAEGDGEPDGYDLVCGQGRLEAVIKLGDNHIPALIIDTTKEDRLVLSLVENIARRQCRALEHASSIERLANEGYSHASIAKKTNLSAGYVSQILTLLRKGEERLLDAALSKRIPLSVAVKIVESDDSEIRKALLVAYENKELTPKSLRIARRLAEFSKQGNKALRWSGPRRKKPEGKQDVVAVYRQEMRKRTALIQKARQCEERLIFVTTALKKLMADDNFKIHLRAENLMDMPSQFSGGDNK